MSTLVSKVNSRLSSERFSIMLAAYEDEQETLRSKCESLRAEITVAKATSDNARKFIRRELLFP